MRLLLHKTLCHIFSHDITLNPIFHQKLSLHWLTIGEKVDQHDEIGIYANPLRKLANLTLFHHALEAALGLVFGLMLGVRAPVGACKGFKVPTCWYR